MTRESLHRLIDDLPDEDIPTAGRVLEALRATADPVRRSLDQAPFDDEPDDDDLDGGLTAARKEAETEPGITTAELRDQAY
jgi:hypothetical protein